MMETTVYCDEDLEASAPADDYQGRHGEDFGLDPSVDNLLRRIREHLAYLDHLKRRQSIEEQW